MRKVIYEVMNREANEDEFVRFKTLAEGLAFKDTLKSFVLEHPQIDQVLLENAENIWGIKPSRVQISAWKQELAQGVPVTSIISSMLETEEAANAAKTYLQKLLGKDLADPQVGVWKDLFWQDWKVFLAEKDGLKLWRDKIVSSQAMKEELILIIGRYYERDGQPEDFVYWQEKLRSDKDLTLSDLESMIVDSPEVSVKLNQIFVSLKEKDLDFSDLEELTERLKSVRDWKQMRSDMKK